MDFPLSSKDMLTAYPTFFLRFLALLCASSLLPALEAQSTESDLKTRLMNKPLCLRGCWRNDTLHFDSVGQLQDKSGVVTFTLSGFELKKLYIKPDKLILEGRRIGLELANNKRKRVPINAGKANEPEDDLIHLEIAASPTGDYGAALDAIFLDDLSDFVPSLPSYWRAYGEKNLARVGGSSAAASAPSSINSTQQSAIQNDAKLMHVGGAVKPPRLIHSVDPTFNNVARGLLYSGKVLIQFEVTQDGKVTNMSLVQPLGMGLDESALTAVQQYIFSPATMDGKPVSVEINVQINFQIF
jgi:TonB family protein